jgi:signal transduction histidine kinase/CheY-like chemotaxis protein
VRSGRLSDALYDEQVRTTYAHLPLTLAVSVLNSVLVGFVIGAVVSKPKILLWMGLVVGLSAIRLIAWRVYLQLGTGSRQKSFWTRVLPVGSCVSGLLWGCTPILFAPLDDAHVLFLALVIAGMCAGAATVHATHFPSVIAFIVPAILPITATFLVQGSKLQVVSGVMAAVFGVSLCLSSLRFRTWFRETTAARLILARRRKAIIEANLRLQAEIADHHATETKLRHAQKMEAIGLVTAGIAHDFNNILLAIGGSAELIVRHRGPVSPQAPQFRTIIQAVERAATLTRQLLAVGRKQSLMPRPADVNEVLRGMEELLITTLGGHGGVELQLADAPAVAFVDAAELEHAVLNLVINARDAMEENGGSVTIKTANLDIGETNPSTGVLVGSVVMISVSDTGNGMSESVRLRAFDPFFTTKDVGKGSGLGLSQVYGLVKQSGGETIIDSHVGRGTTVSIYLPRASKELVSAQAARKHPSDGASKNPIPKPTRKTCQVLVLDDDDQVLDTLSEILRDFGYSVAAFGSALQALEEVTGPKPIDLMIVDYAMPEMRGDEFAAKARMQRSSVPILFISGYADATGLEYEPNVLRKPFSVDLLISTIEEAIHVAA